MYRKFNKQLVYSKKKLKLSSIEQKKMIALSKNSSDNKMILKRIRTNGQH